MGCEPRVISPNPSAASSARPRNASPYYKANSVFIADFHVAWRIRISRGSVFDDVAARNGGEKRLTNSFFHFIFCPNLGSLAASPSNLSILFLRPVLIRFVFHRQQTFKDIGREVSTFGDKMLGRPLLFFSFSLFLSGSCGWGERTYIFLPSSSSSSSCSSSSPFFFVLF